MNLRVKRFDKDLPLPSYERGGAACFDLICREDQTIAPQEIALVPANIAIQLPDGYALMVYARSSTPMRRGLMLANGVGIVDPFYRGDRDEVLIEFWNYTQVPVEIRRGDTLAQAMLIRHEPVSWDEVETFGEEGVGGYSTDWHEE